AAFSHHPASDPNVYLPPALRPLPPAPTTWPWVALAIAWALGAGIVLARALIAYRRALPRGPLAPAHLRALYPRVVIGDDAVGPHVIGILRPTIVLPPALLADEALVRAALLHELAHVRRRDGLGRLLQVLARAML